MSLVSRVFDLLVALLLVVTFIAQSAGYYSTQRFIAIAAFMAAIWAFGTKYNDT